MDAACSQSCSDCTSRLACRCLKITEEAVVHAITVMGFRTVREIRKATGAGTGCMCCHGLLARLIERHTEPVEARRTLVALTVEAS